MSIVRCDDCDGAGRFPDEIQCSTCGGEGCLPAQSEIDRLRTELAAKDARIAELEDLQLEAKRIDLAASNIAFRRDSRSRSACSRSSRSRLNFSWPILFALILSLAGFVFLNSAQAELPMSELSWKHSSKRAAMICEFCTSMMDCCRALILSSNENSRTVHNDSTAMPPSTSHVASLWTAAEYVGDSSNMPAPTVNAANMLTDRRTIWGHSGSASPDQMALKYVTIAAILSWLIVSVLAVGKLMRAACEVWRERHASSEELLDVEETGELILRPIERLIDRAERAEARIAELDVGEDTTTMTRKSFVEVLKALSDETARAEKAEANAHRMLVDRG